MSSKGTEDDEAESKIVERVTDTVILESNNSVVKTTSGLEAVDEWEDQNEMARRWKICLIVSAVLITLVIIAGLLLWYFKVIPETIEYTDSSVHQRKCTPLRIPLCHKYRVPYSYTIFPNTLGHEIQLDAGEGILRYESLISVKCYELLPLLLCTFFAPKCIDKTMLVPPCKSLCIETIRRCEFFLKVFSVEWPEGMDCEYLPDSPDPEICVGQAQMKNLEKNSKACTDGFRCDRTLCIPKNWTCDGYADCGDLSDERDCHNCAEDEYYCGNNKCIEKSQFCDGVRDCPDGREERKCLRLTKYQGHDGEGLLESYSLVSDSWQPVCGNHWDPYTMSSKVCSALGYRTVNETRLRDETSMEHRLAVGARTNDKRIGKLLFRKNSQDRCSDDPVFVYLKCQDFQCGKSANDFAKASWRIVGGIESEPGEWPWLVALHGGPDEVFFCGGVLISEWWVLSAAHCVGNQSDTTGWSLKLGMTRRTSFEAYTQQRGLAEIIRHPGFSSVSFYGNDLVILRLDRPVPFNALLRPICLPTPNLPPTALKSCTVIGWGKHLHDDEADYQVVIHKVQLPIVDFETCAKWYSIQDVTISDKMLCAGYEEGLKDACQGDSGGPLVCKDRDHWFVAGVVSWGIKCAQPNLPGIYTNVPLYVDWILNVTREAGYPIES